MKYNKYKLDNSILFDVYTYPKNSNSLQEYIHKFTEKIILTAALEKSGRNYEYHIDRGLKSNGTKTYAKTIRPIQMAALTA